MTIKTFLSAFLAAGLLAGSALAQTAQPAAPAATTPPPAAARPATPAPAARTSLPAGTKVNLNTASAEQLDSLPQIGKARAKVIMDERAKAPFKDWADFEKRMQHTSVNAGVKAKIKDLVSF